MEGSSTVCTSSRLSACALGFAVGLLSALWLVVLGVAAMYFNFGVEFVKLAGTVYVGFAATFKGVVFGALWGFLEGFVCGALIAVFYNFCAKCCKCVCSCCNKDVKTVV
jgi:hypothetical protein